jgi:transposase
VLDLLPERSVLSIAQWLQAHPSVEIVCRDRSRLYAEGIRHGALQAVQVVDRLHLVQNLREALERFFLRHRRDLNTLGASLHQSSELTPTPAMLSRARLARWVHRYHEIQRLRAQQLGIAAIARRVQVSRPTVYRYLAMPQPPETLLAHLFRLGPVMIATYHHVQAFCRMVRQRRGDEFDAWGTAVQHTSVKELRAFVNGLLKDEAAVRAGLELVWSNGPTEGCIHRLKLLKRQAYGRAGVDFLRYRILAPSTRKAA